MKRRETPGHLPSKLKVPGSNPGGVATIKQQPLDHMKSGNAVPLIAPRSMRAAAFCPWPKRPKRTDIFVRDLRPGQRRRRLEPSREKNDVRQARPGPQCFPLCSSRHCSKREFSSLPEHISELRQTRCRLLQDRVRQLQVTFNSAKPKFRLLMINALTG